MEQVVDFHVHSRYAYATSKDMNVAGLYHWSKLKGITVVGTGDCTHPAWVRELEKHLVSAENGLWQLETKLAVGFDNKLPKSCSSQALFFVPTVEVSLIYSSTGRVRKIHLVIVLPDFTSVHALNTILATKGNLAADGRPTFGISCEEMLDIVLLVTDQAVIIPAHAWTPWFGIFGSKSGFDSLSEAFGNKVDQITAIETGLSSDPAMNWQIAALQAKTIVSFSDAHSPRKLGREATVIDCELSYAEIIGAIKTNDDRLVGTIEFFPQEGKYHLDGHRECGVSLEPAETQKINGVCPVCGKQLTVGVLSRVQAVAQQDPAAVIQQKKRVEYIIPLAEIIAAQAGIKSTTSQTVESIYQQLLAQFGNEFFILRHLKIEALLNAGFIELAANIQAMRNGEITIVPGFDGQYGKIVVPDRTVDSHNQQLTLGF